MQSIKLIFIYLLAFLSCSFLLSIGLSPLIIFILLFIYLLIFTLLPYINIVFWTKNLKKIDRFLQNNRNKIFLSYFYSFVNESKEQQHSLLQEIVKLKQPPDEKQYFKSMLALLNDDFLKANLEADKISEEELRIYTLAYIAIFKEDDSVAYTLANDLQTSWRKYAIHSLLAFRHNKLDDFHTFSSYALAKTRGIDHYVLNHILNKK